jgi:hypothetical protein
MYMDLSCPNFRDEFLIEDLSGVQRASFRPCPFPKDSRKVNDFSMICSNYRAQHTGPH